MNTSTMKISFTSLSRANMAENLDTAVADDLLNAAQDAGREQQVLMETANSEQVSLFIRTPDLGQVFTFFSASHPLGSFCHTYFEQTMASANACFEGLDIGFTKLQY